MQPFRSHVQADSRQPSDQLGTRNPDEPEFKIVRSNWGAFRKPEKLRAVLDEEARGGWVLVEKFDDDRIRLKRPAGTKPIEGDFVDGYDPYRTNVGMSRQAIALTAIAVAVSLAATMILVAVLLSKR